MSSLLQTTVIGSYPRYPKLVGDGFNERWLVSPGNNLDKAWKEKENLGELQDEATAWAVREQEDTGIDIISDGEQRRGNFVFYHCQNFGGFNFEKREMKALRGGTRNELVPTINEPITHKDNYLVKDFKFIQKLTKKGIKATIAGPMTIADSVVDSYYKDDKELTLAIARAINTEVLALVKSGCNLIQFDEPVFIREPKKFFRYGIEALHEALKGLSGVTTTVHICRGYPNKEKDVKADKAHYSNVIKELSKSKIDHIAIEDAHENLDLSTFKNFGSKSVVLGCVDIGEDRVETVEEIEKRVNQVLTLVDPNNLLLAPDCGLLLLKSQVAKAKLSNIVKAAQKIRKQYN